MTASAISGCSTTPGFESTRTPRTQYTTNAMEKIERTIYSDESVNLTTGLVRASYRDSKDNIVNKAFFSIPLEGNHRINYFARKETDPDTGLEVEVYETLTPVMTTNVVLVDFEQATQIFNMYNQTGNVDVEDTEVLVLKKSLDDRIDSNLIATWKINQHGGWTTPPEYEGLIQKIAPETEALVMYGKNGVLGVVINPTMGPRNSGGRWIDEENGIFEAPLTVGYAEGGGIFAAIPGRVEKDKPKNNKLHVPMFNEVKYLPTEKSYMVPSANVAEPSSDKTNSEIPNLPQNNNDENVDAESLKEFLDEIFNPPSS